jgi:hypothetical protein
MNEKQQEVNYLLEWKPEVCNLALDLGCGDPKVAPDFIGVDRFRGKNSQINRGCN